MKHCRWCDQTKPIADFYPHSRMADGYLNKCKECVKLALRHHRATNPAVQDHERRRYREGKRHPSARPQPRIASRARSTLNNAIRDGKMVRPNLCEACGKTDVPIEGAHHDYGQPLDVRWLCRPCHRRWDYADPKTARLAS